MIPLDELVDELRNDPAQLGYTEPAAAGDVVTILALLTAVHGDDPAYLVPRGLVRREDFVKDCQRLGVWKHLLVLQGTQSQKYAAWAFYAQVVLPNIDAFDVNGETFARSLAQMRTDGLTDDAGATYLTMRAGSRAEVLWGAGMQPTIEQIAGALGRLR